MLTHRAWRSTKAFCAPMARIRENPRANPVRKDESSMADRSTASGRQKTPEHCQAGHASTATSQSKHAAIPAFRF